MRNVCLIIACLVLVGCGTIRDWRDKVDDFKDWDELSLEELWDRARGKPAVKDMDGWRLGSHRIDVPSKPANWKWEIHTKDIPLTRPDGKPERMFLEMRFTNGKIYPYFMPDNRDFVRMRAKGGTNYNLHVGGWILKPLPRDVARWEFSVTNGVFDVEVDDKPLGRKGSTGNKNYLPLKVPGAKLRSIVISPDPGRPAGCKWIAGEVE